MKDRKGWKPPPGAKVTETKLPKTPRRHKYNASRTEVNGIVFASKKEAKRYQELLLLQQAGEISDLELQPEFPLVVAEVVIGKFTPDFRYFDKRLGRRVVEDVKSPATKTTAYRLRKRMFEAYYKIPLSEV